MIGICTDSNSQLPSSLAERYAIEVVPITVTIGDHDYLEGIDLDPDDFYELISADPRPSLSTSQPSPGQFAAAYESLLNRGCDEILSIHVTAAASGTLNAARLATRSLEVPVRLVDSGTASFGVSCCVWAAADAVAHGANLDEAVRVAETLAPRIGLAFAVSELEFIKTGGRGPRFDLGGADSDSDTSVPILTMVGGQITVVSRAATMADAVDSMAAMAIGWGPRLKVAVGLAHRSSQRFSEALEAAVKAAPNVVEIVRYRIGPSIGAYTGPGTVGCFMFPAD
jgi:DegV family protein with EDD domain